jgi:hypothetical protein
MRGIIAACLLAIIANLTLTLQVQPASACSCFIPSIRDGLSADERNLLGQIGESSLVVMKARVVRPQGSGTILEPVVVYRGHHRAQYEVESPNCNGIIADFGPGEEWLVTLKEGTEADYSAHGCTSHRAGSEFAAAYEEYFRTARGSTPVLALTIGGVLVGVAAIGFVALKWASRAQG